MITDGWPFELVEKKKKIIATAAVVDISKTTKHAIKIEGTKETAGNRETRMAPQTLFRGTTNSRE